MRLLLTVLITAGLGIGAVGCVKHTSPVAAQPELTSEQESFLAMWRASLEVLRRYHFEVDRKDRRAGVIITAPLTGQYFWEFWRGDAAGPANLAESTIQTIYRVVKVEIRPRDEGGGFVPAVEVATFRSDNRTPQITSTAEAYDMFIGSAGRYVIKDVRPGAPSVGGRVPLAADSELQQKLSQEILQTAAQ